jgi:two-component system chemotaxis response regulator CheB
MEAGRIRVLVVDDAVVIRRVVSEVLAADPALEVCGFASNGRLALAKVAQQSPDLIVLDVEMPEMDGLETLAALRRDRPRLPVIMYSSTTRRGAAATLDALALGANDYVTKPTGQESPDAARRRIAADLIPRIKALCARPAGAPAPGRAASTAALLPPPPRPRPPGRPTLLAVGCSTGGPNALAELIPALGGALDVPLVIVQHMPPIFTRMLAERLTARGGFPVREAVDGAPLRPGVAWIAPGDFHLVVAREGANFALHTHRGPTENSCRPSVDVLFRSVAATHGEGVLAVVLTGMGQDGLRGCEAIRARGGGVIVQDEASSVVWGMPGFVARAGLADRVLPLAQIGPALVAALGPARPAPAAVPAAAAAAASPQ